MIDRCQANQGKRRSQCRFDSRYSSLSVVTVYLGQQHQVVPSAQTRTGDNNSFTAPWHDDDGLVRELSLIRVVVGSGTCLPTSW